MAVDHMAKPLIAWDAVAIVVNREYAGVVCEALFLEDFQRPEACLRDGITRSAIPKNALASRILKDAHRTPRFLTEFFRRLHIDTPVGVAVRCHFMPTRLDRAYQVRMPFDHPSQNKKGRLRSVGIQEI